MEMKRCEYCQEPVNPKKKDWTFDGEYYHPRCVPAYGEAGGSNALDKSS